MSRYVNVTISRQTKPVSEAGFGLALILGTSKDSAYKTYSDLDQVKVDFDDTTEEFKLASAILNQEPKPEKVAILGVAYDSESESYSVLTNALDELVKVNNDFYYLTSVEQGGAEVSALANWVFNKDKIYVASISEMTDLILMKIEAESSNKYDNVFIMVHDQPKTYPAEALVGAICTKPIGSYTWTFKTLRNVPVAKFDDGEIDAIHNENASTYIREGGVNISSRGITLLGEYVDVVQSTHFLKARMTEYVYRLLTMNPKIPYTDAGIALVVAEVEKVLNLGFKQGIIADEEGVPMYSITVPKRADIDKNTIAKRILPDVKWKAVIAGAVEQVEIEGVLTL
ncbi:DUF3383 family protein [Bacillus infantis]|uniref:DUF3383 family protein n=1 Tax=Bacillus infantis TaxID=324767 RepID=UPI00196AB74D|nr:DUF3383 family protein [Bacillus infantis]